MEFMSFDDFLLEDGRSEYREFFKDMLQSEGYDNIGEIPSEKKKEFFAKVSMEWKKRKVNESKISWMNDVDTKIARKLGFKDDNEFGEFVNANDDKYFQAQTMYGYDSESNTFSEESTPSIVIDKVSSMMKPLADKWKERRGKINEYRKDGLDFPSEEEVLRTIFDCVFIRGIDLEDFRRNFSNEQSGLYDALVKLFASKMSESIVLDNEDDLLAIPEMKNKITKEQADKLVKYFNEQDKDTSTPPPDYAEEGKKSIGKTVKEAANIFSSGARNFEYEWLTHIVTCLYGDKYEIEY
jgi:hypothetical protein